MRRGIFIGGSLVYAAVALSYLVDLTGFCASSDKGTMYTNKKDKSIRIIARDYECFLTAGDWDLFKERNLTAHWKWVTPFNEKPVDTTKWHPVEWR